jgi:hypothetical protein
MPLDRVREVVRELGLDLGDLTASGGEDGAPVARGATAR